VAPGWTVIGFGAALRRAELAGLEVAQREGVAWLDRGAARNCTDAVAPSAGNSGNNVRAPRTARTSCSTDAPGAHSSCRRDCLQRRGTVPSRPFIRTPVIQVTERSASVRDNDRHCSLEHQADGDRR
jgi:hypothetical protein